MPCRNLGEVMNCSFQASHFSTKTLGYKNVLADTYERGKR